MLSEIVWAIFVVELERSLGRDWRLRYEAGIGHERPSRTHLELVPLWLARRDADQQFEDEVPVEPWDSFASGELHEQVRAATARLARCLPAA